MCALARLKDEKGEEKGNKHFQLLPGWTFHKFETHSKYNTRSIIHSRVQNFTLNKAQLASHLYLPDIFIFFDLRVLNMASSSSDKTSRVSFELP